jgi:hypothetical protein
MGDKLLLQLPHIRQVKGRSRDIHGARGMGSPLPGAMHRATTPSLSFRYFDAYEVLLQLPLGLSRISVKYGETMGLHPFG